MKIIERGDKRYEVRIPRKFSPSGKRESHYFRDKADAEDFIKQYETERQEHGRQVITASDRRWLGYLYERIGDLSLLPEIINYYKRSGEGLKPIATQDAIKSFLDVADSEYGNRRTLSDIVSRLRMFGTHFGARPLHEITVSDVEQYLAKFKQGWNRWGHYKRLKPFYKFARRKRWVPADPMLELPVPRTPDPERAIYSPEQFERMLQLAEEAYEPLLPFIVLSGFCFMRTGELLKSYKSDRVLQWNDILYDETPPLIHVRPGTAKGTRRQSDERHIPLNETAQKWLARYRNESGDCVQVRNFSHLWHRLLGVVNVPAIPNGLRHSCISYSLAANPEHGLALTAQFAGNSEATIRKHYRRLIKPSEAARWFQVQSYAEWMEELDAELRRDPDLFKGR
jgi:hypothetical protein